MPMFRLSKADLGKIAAAAKRLEQPALNSACGTGEIQPCAQRAARTCHLSLSCRRAVRPGRGNRSTGLSGVGFQCHPNWSAREMTCDRPCAPPVARPLASFKSGSSAPMILLWTA